MKNLLLHFFIFTMTFGWGQSKYKNIHVDSIPYNGRTEMLNLTKQKLKLSSNFELYSTKSFIDQLGLEHYTITPEYQNIPFMLANIGVHTSNNKIYHIESSNLLVIDTISNKDESFAVTIAKLNCPSQDFIWLTNNATEFLQSELDTSYLNPFKGVFYVPQNLSDTNSTFCKAFVYHIYTLSPLSNTQYFISCKTGNLLYSNSLICDLTGQVATTYNGNREVTTTQRASNKFELYQDGPRCIIEANFLGVDIFDDNNNWGGGDNFFWNSGLIDISGVKNAENLYYD
jgi:Zn-dependent metalloprotease